jgi:hypothetical protein
VRDVAAFLTTWMISDSCSLLLPLSRNILKIHIYFSHWQV